MQPASLTQRAVNRLNQQHQRLQALKQYTALPPSPPTSDVSQPIITSLDWLPPITDEQPDSDKIIAFKERLRHEIELIAETAEDNILPIDTDFERQWGITPDQHYSLHHRRRSFIKPSTEQPQQSADSFFAGGEYAHELILQMRQVEHNFVVTLDYMPIQPDITPHMRTILIEWLVEVRLAIPLLNETLYLAVNIIDRFLAKCKISFNTFQLVGITAIFIAAKHEEVKMPSITDFAYLCDDKYTIQQIVNMELLLLEATQFRLSFPSPFLFLLKFIGGSSTDAVDANILYISRFICDLAIIDYAFTPLRPSMLATSALLLARMSVLPETETLWVSKEKNSHNSFL